MDLNTFIDTLRSKAKFKDIDKNFIEFIIKSVLTDNEIKFILNFDEKKGGKEQFKNLVKKCRKVLHEIYEVYFPVDANKLFSYLDNPEDLLRFSIPTRERLPFYNRIYPELLDGKDVVILDMACGLNPISAIYLEDRLKFYYCFDISHSLCNLINEFFRKKKIPGKCFVFNIFEFVERYSELLDFVKEPVDYVFLWKTVPLIEKYRRGYTYKIMRNLEGKYVILSYSRKSLGRRRYIGRYWIGWTKNLAEHTGWEVVKLYETINEVFIKLKNKKLS